MGGTGNASSLGMYTSDGTTKNVQIAAGGTSYFNAGDIGIGTTSPTAKLHLYVNSANNDTFQIFNGSVRTHLLGSESSNGVIYMRSSANSNTIRINASGDSYFNGGNVGIGTTLPSNYNSYADNLVVADSAHSGISIASGTTSLGTLMFADGTSGTAVIEVVFSMTTIPIV